MNSNHKKTSRRSKKQSRSKPQVAKSPQLRIIAGRWRSRKVEFAASQTQLRPTPDRVRETLFNWLAPVIAGARCLDLFAGSGILSFEALSRGAASVTAIERDHIVCVAILAAAQRLGGSARIDTGGIGASGRAANGVAKEIAGGALEKVAPEKLVPEKLAPVALQIIQQDVLTWLDQTALAQLAYTAKAARSKSSALVNQFEIIFLDPPYGSDQQLLLACCQKIANLGLLKPGGYIYFEHNQPAIEDNLPQQWRKFREQHAGQVYYYLYCNSEFNIR